MGRSLGGQTAVRLSLKIAREQLPIRGPPLGLALAITPGCTSQPKDGELTRGTEVWFFLADHDMSPHERCITYVEKMVAAGGDAHFRVYPETFHTFDGSAKPIWHPHEEVYANCANDRISPRLLCSPRHRSGNSDEERLGQVLFRLPETRSMGWWQSRSYPPTRSGLDCRRKAMVARQLDASDLEPCRPWSAQSLARRSRPNLGVKIARIPFMRPVMSSWRIWFGRLHRRCR